MVGKFLKASGIFVTCAKWAGNHRGLISRRVCGRELCLCRARTPLLGHRRSIFLAPRKTRVGVGVSFLQPENGSKPLAQQAIGQQKGYSQKQHGPDAECGRQVVTVTQYLEQFEERFGDREIGLFLGQHQ